MTLRYQGDRAATNRLQRMCVDIELVCTSCEGDEKSKADLNWHTLPVGEDQVSWAHGSNHVVQTLPQRQYIHTQPQRRRGGKGPNRL